MAKMKIRLASILLVLIWPVVSAAEDIAMELPLQPPGQWTFVSDQVMGGVSTGQARIEARDGVPVLHLTGEVSTQNNGGFIQARTKLAARLDPKTSGVIMKVQGNDQRYFIHLRTSGTALPWQYYQAPFEATGQWQTVSVPFSQFKPSGRLLRASLRPENIRSLGIVAYGRPHTADLSVEFVGFF